MSVFYISLKVEPFLTKIKSEKNISDTVMKTPELGYGRGELLQSGHGQVNLVISQRINSPQIGPPLPFRPHTVTRYPSCTFKNICNTFTFRDRNAQSFV